MDSSSGLWSDLLLEDLTPEDPLCFNNTLEDCPNSAGNAALPVRL